VQNAGALNGEWNWREFLREGFQFGAGCHGNASDMVMVRFYAFSSSYNPETLKKNEVQDDQQSKI
jgi:hypothetical protein